MSFTVWLVLTSKKLNIQREEQLTLRNVGITGGRRDHHGSRSENAQA
ncbi:hypothetical protein [Vibrio anguillarum]|nr:hypothetical protein [Vibrio anguillarum]